MAFFLRPASITTIFLTFFGGWNIGSAVNSGLTNYNCTQFNDCAIRHINHCAINTAPSKSRNLSQSNLNYTFSSILPNSMNSVEGHLFNPIVPNGDSNRLEYTVDGALAPNRIAVINQIMDEAIAMLDRPYRAGGKTPAGFDCSGFVSYCYLQGNEQKLPVSSREYINKGTPVDVADALPGDVIMFSGSRASQTLVGHVGIISEVSDDIYFIHSATSSGIRYDRMSSPYYQKRFIGIRRF